MLLAKINPPAKMVTQPSPFTEPVQTVGEYMRVSTERYLMGSTSVRFQVAFGQTVPSGVDRYEFRSIHSQSVTLSGPDLDGWGSDDTFILEKIAEKIGLTVTETVEINIMNDF
jgi:hypothetical protein